jgi:uncharacterized protein YndB with AHSA1/START domain
MGEATAVASVSIEATRASVWNALTDPELIRQYFMGATVSTDWKIGHPISFSGEFKGQAYEDKGEVLVVEPEVRLSFSHWSPLTGTQDVPENYHVVDIALRDDNGTTNVTLTQSNFTGGVTKADHSSRADYEKNWSATLQGLKATVEGG